MGTMRKQIMPIASLGLAAAIAGCNTTDALIPQVDVGGGTFRSPPVTQSDLEAMSTQTAVMPVESVPPSRTAAFAAQPNISVPPTHYATSHTDYTDPAGTLEAQASRLAEGVAPVQTMQPQPSVPENLPPQAENPPPQVESQRAQARNVAPPEEESAEQPAQPDVAAAAEKTQQAAASPAPTATGAGGIRFLPIIGAPVQAVTPLSKQLGASARAQGITIKSSTDTSSDHILKGYFSALNDSGKTTVVYVWDILDGGGNRLHRIQGQDTVESSAAEPWSAIPPETMQAIAEKTIDAYLEWRQSQRG
ncbi:lipoprotein, putative [Sinorhizobium sp. CCBAU 05631]|nr:lipoprotein, putative [Sinorhizobium sp. CCBAU 05631]